MYLDEIYNFWLHVEVAKKLLNANFFMFWQKISPKKKKKKKKKKKNNKDTGNS